MRKIRLFLAAAAAALTVGMGLIVIAGMQDQIADADLIVVPGNTIAPDGTPSPRLKARLDAALKLYKERRAPLLFVSGGVGKEGFDEAVSMAAYLEKNGVPSNSIILDDAGLDTAATARNAALLMRERGLKTALVATQYFHVPRTRLALERNGILVAGSAYARYFEMRDLYSTLRETIAYVAYYAKS